MQWPREDACAGQPGMPHMLLARQQSSRTSPRTSWVRPPMRSRPHVLPRRKERARAQGGSSAGGSATSSQRRFASSYSTTSGCGTTSVGRCSTAESASGHLLVNWVKSAQLLRRNGHASARNMEIDSGESREVAPETNCFAPFWEMDEGSAGYIDVSQLLPSPLRSVSASLVLGLHAR